MKTPPLKTTIKPLLFLLVTNPLCADTFGTGGNQFAMDFVPIASGLEAESIPQNSVFYGAVPYDYRIGKHEVSRGMITAYNALGGGPVITLENMTDFGGNGVGKPATGVTWNEAARFVNWLNVSTGHNPAYKFTTGGANDNLALWTAGESGYDASNPFRNTNARYFLPSEDEWHRAAHFDPVAKAFWDYPTGTNVPTAPTSVTSGTAPNTAVYNLAPTVGPADVTLAGGLSPFGTMGQGGNVLEWVESSEVAPNNSPVADRVIRGGAWYLDRFGLYAVRQGEPTTYPSFAIGFRVASKALPVPVLKMRNPRLSAGGFTVDIESNVGPVDVYRSQELENWGTVPIATMVSPGLNVVIDPTPPPDRAFYLITPQGTPPP